MYVPPKMRRASAIVMLSVLFASAHVPAVMAQDPDPGEPGDVSEADYKRLLVDAQAKFKAGDLEGAAKAYEEAYALKENPNLLYNIGRIYEKTGKFDKAIEFYEIFVKKPDIKLEARQDALARIKTLREVVALDKPPEEPEKPEEKTEPKEPEEKKVVEIPEEPEPDPVEPNYVPGIVFVGLGAVSALGAGGAAFLVTQSEQEAADATTLADYRAAVESGRTTAYVADGLTVASGVFLVTGIVLLVTQPSESPGNALIVPTVGPDGAGVMGHIRF